ncbi:hypothetical protein ACFFX1_10765 [Dactylosporangium sucinum]|uniref:Uncharacterized protein n=1 Tax=Dactylosporangium sucinum TaxID=1424081 RepID=A0A917THX0_9ACTN|nr:hypothetical protein [Dactylosporangium sucinum]GGM23034.1 hypothetical protein GCM10007977_025290 [Dactylosporangium sucinum]
MLLAGAVVMLLGLVGLVWSSALRSTVAARWPKRLLLCGSVAAPVQVGGYLMLGQWEAAALFALVGMVLFGRWESHREADGQRVWLLPWLDRAVLRRLPISRRHIDRMHAARGDRGLTLTDLRAEYAGPIIEDATRDPQLDALLDVLSAELLAIVLRIEADMDSTGTRPWLVTRYMILTGIANGVLADATEPGASVGARPYRGYSRPMLTLAAACRLGSSAELKPT